MGHPMPRLFLIRHGETEWSLNGRHTGRSDIPLTARGEDVIKSKAPIVIGANRLIDPSSLQHIFVSPRQRATKTFQLLFSGLPSLPVHEITEDVREWDYGLYEGLVTSEIHKLDKNWDIFRDGCPEGESAEQMATRMDGVIAQVRDLHSKYLQASGGRDVMIVAHGHFTRCLIARWLNYPLALGEGVNVEPGGITVLSYNHGDLNEPTINALNLYAY